MKRVLITICLLIFISNNALLSDELFGWGHNQYGRLGDGTNIDKNTPIQIGNTYNLNSII